MTPTSSSDPFILTSNCVNRLLREYEKHPRLIIAVDFDDTVYDFHQQQATHDEVLALLRRCQELDFYIVLFTASHPDRYSFMLDYMEDKGIHPSAINENPIVLKYGNNRKIYYNILLDDRAGLGQAVQTLTVVLDSIERRKHAERQSDGQMQAL